MAGGCKFGRSKIPDKFKSVDEEYRAEIETVVKKFTKEGTEILKKVAPRTVKVHSGFLTGSPLKFLSEII